MLALGVLSATPTQAQVRGSAEWIPAGRNIGIRVDGDFSQFCTTFCDQAGGNLDIKHQVLNANLSGVLAQYRPELPVLVMREALAGISPRNPELLVAELRASVEQAAELTRKLVRACETLPQILTETRRLRAESADLLAAARGSDRLNRRDDFAAGRVVLGSAVRAAGAPAWYCRDCEHRWPA